MRVNVCVPVRTCTRVHASMRACVHACMRACVHACMRACVHACMRACVHACVRACMCVCASACVYVRAKNDVLNVVAFASHPMPARRQFNAVRALTLLQNAGIEPYVHDSQYSAELHAKVVIFVCAVWHASSKIDIMLL